MLFYEGRPKGLFFCAAARAPFPWAVCCGPYCPFHPISLLLRKETGWSPKETRLGGRRKRKSTVTPAQPTDRAKQPQAVPFAPGEGKCPDTHQPPPQVGRGTYRLPTCSAHANGGAAGVKKRLSLAARHRFFGQAPKKWGRMAGQGNDPLPTYRRTRTSQK